MRMLGDPSASHMVSNSSTQCPYDVLWGASDWTAPRVCISSWAAELWPVGSVFQHPVSTRANRPWSAVPLLRFVEDALESRYISATPHIRLASSKMRYLRCGSV